MAASLLDMLAEWLPHQRWYPLKGSAGLGARPVITGSFELPSPHPWLALQVLLVTITVPSERDAELTLQVPLSFHRDSTDELSGTGSLATGMAGAGVDSSVQAGALLGELLGELSPGDGWPGGRVYDGLADPAFLQAWLGQAVGATASTSGSSRYVGPGQESLRDHTLQTWRNPGIAGLAAAAVSDIRVLLAEQSNTSVMFRLGDMPLIAKFFRVLHAGTHPEVEIGRALAEASERVGALNVPALQAAVSHGEADTTLFVVHDFISGARDGWALALAAAGHGTDFSAHARTIGEALANVHRGLRAGLGVHQVAETEAARIAETIVARLEWAWGLAHSAVGGHEEAFRDVVAQLSHLDSVPQLQRIHGDLHLGQLLHRDAEGQQEWFILDFEGEPLRPLAERVHPDVALRDVVGMLRSFDYAGAQAAATGAVTKEQGLLWAQTCSDALIEGYETSSGERIARTSSLFMALWLDKALYEVVYELQNRPSWVWVPVRAVQNFFESRESGVAWD